MTAAIANLSFPQLEAVLAQEGAAARLAKADCALADFLAEHGKAAPWREYQALLIERDDALRQLRKAELDIAQLDGVRR